MPLTDFVGGCREYFTALVENGKCVRRFDTAHGEYFLPTQHAEIYRLEDWGDMSTELEYVSTEREERRENAAGVDAYNAELELHEAEAEAHGSQFDLEHRHQDWPGDRDEPAQEEEMLAAEAQACGSETWSSSRAGDMEMGAAARDAAELAAFTEEIDFLGAEAQALGDEQMQERDMALCTETDTDGTKAPPEHAAEQKRMRLCELWDQYIVHVKRVKKCQSHKSNCPPQFAETCVIAAAGGTSHYHCKAPGTLKTEKQGPCFSASFVDKRAAERHLERHFKDERNEGTIAQAKSRPIRSGHKLPSMLAAQPQNEGTGPKDVETSSVAVWLKHIDGNLLIGNQQIHLPPQYELALALEELTKLHLQDAKHILIPRSSKAADILTAATLHALEPSEQAIVKRAIEGCQSTIKVVCTYDDACRYIEFCKQRCTTQPWGRCVTLGGKPLATGATHATLLTIGATCFAGLTTKESLHTSLARIEAENLNTNDSFVLSAMFPTTTLILIDAAGDEVMPFVGAQRKGWVLRKRALVGVDGLSTLRIRNYKFLNENGSETQGSLLSERVFDRIDGTTTSLSKKAS